MSDYKYLYKIIIIGDSGCGKTSIAEQFINNDFVLNQTLTIGVEFSVGHLKLSDDIGIKLQIWDTAGQESFRSITKAYYRNALGAIVVFDLTRRRSFDNVKHWLEELKRLTSEHAQIVLVGNKKDLEHKRKVSEIDAIELANKHGLKYIETSAKDYDSCSSVFNTIAEVITNSIENKNIDELCKINGLKIFNKPKIIEIKEDSYSCCTIL